METTYLICHRKSANEPYVKEAIKAVRKEGRDFRVVVPFNKREKPRIVREALDAGATRIIAGGGDGTINAVVDAIVGSGQERSDVTLGVFPLGTANDFARGCGLPTEDLAECLRIACDREGRDMDVGVLNGRNFVNVASLGFGAEITATTPVNLKKALGGAAYTLMGLIRALNLSPYPGRVEIPDDDDIVGSVLFAAVANNRFAGGGFEVAPLARIDDGLLDLTAIHTDRGMALGSISSELEDPMNPANRHVAYRQLAEFRVISDQKMHCNLDGEPIHKKKLHFQVRPRHLKVAY